MSRYYLDANPLLRRAEALRPASADERCVNVASTFDSLEAGGEHIWAMSEVTLIEFHSNVARILRDTHPARAAYDEAWAQEAQALVLERVRDARIEMLPLSPKAFEVAMRFITRATVEHSRYLDSWDAVHVHQAERWARDTGDKVNIVTGDRHFRNLFEVFPEFGRSLELVSFEIA